MTITTTLNRIREHSPCGLDPRKLPLTGYQKLVAYLGPDHGPNDPIPYATILESNGLDDALWCCRAEPQHNKEWRLLAVWCARQVQHLMTDPRSTAALDVAERHANNEASDAELDAARAAAWAAAGDAARAAAWDAARAAAWAAAGDAAGDAARAAAWDAARAAVGAASGDAARAAVGAASGDAAGDAARAAAWDAARAAAWDAARAAAWDAVGAAMSAQFLSVVE